jgi:hypothetical protein
MLQIVADSACRPDSAWKIKGSQVCALGKAKNIPELLRNLRICRTGSQEASNISQHRGLDSGTTDNITGRHGGSMVACQTVVLQSRVRIRRLPSPQLTAHLLVGCHLGWHLAPG